jgi:hypothetical protein
MNSDDRIYVALLDEGVDVWRPVEAERLGPDIFRIIGDIPEGESWAFQPGDIVRCREKQLSKGALLVAHERVS